MNIRSIIAVCGLAASAAAGALLLSACSTSKPAYTVSAAEAPPAPGAPAAQPATVARAPLAAQPTTPPPPPTPPTPPTPLGPPDVKAEAPFITNARQLTFPDQFVRAGEAYFDHQTPPQWIIFQAIPKAAEGAQPDPHYAMYVARLKRNERAVITGLDEPIRVSEPGSSSTCGWFHPKIHGMIIFGTTVTPPAETEPAGYSRDRSRYSWQFPVEMRIMTDIVKPMVIDLMKSKDREAIAKSMADFLIATQPFAEGAMDAQTALEMIKGAADGSAVNRAELERPGAPGYAAECSISPDGRHVLLAYMDPEKKDVDIWVMDVRFGATPRFTPLVQAKGYDGGPFFSPDGASICWRSDREGNSELQLFVAPLMFDEKDPKKIIGLGAERQLTKDTGAVNWAPYWSPDGQWLIYASSAQSHQNYELYAINVADPSRRARVTHAPGFDGLPALSDDGRLLMWTSQRAGAAPGESRPSSQLWIADVQGEPAWGK